MKISIIGAGSVRFALQLVGDIAQTEELSNDKTEVCLMDIDEERLNTSFVLAKKYACELGSTINIQKTLSLDVAVDGADFIINTAYPYDRRYLKDGYERWDRVTEIGEKHGYYRGIDSREFNMVSTYSYVLASYPDVMLALEIARKMEKLAPNAWLMQTANPVFDITQIVTRLTNVKIVGFCHGVAGVYAVFEALELDPTKVDWQVAGVNHGIWLNRFLYEGKNAYELFDEWIKKKSKNWEPKNPWDTQLSPAAIDMYKFYGMLPIGDTVRNGSWKYHYNLETKKKWYGKFGAIDNEVERPRFHDAMREARKKMIELAKEVEKDPKIELTKIWPQVFRKGTLSGEQHIPFICAITYDKKTRLVLNVLNNSSIEKLPKDLIVEVPVWVDKNGLRAEKIDPPLTDRIVYFYLYPKIIAMEFAYEAIVSRDKNVLIEALIRDPRTKSYEQAVAVLDEIMEQPFNEEMRKYFNW
ncbi:alpha-glucosidase AglA [Pseudothermotoga thermarum]|uniref:Glycoside hydrolase family 4 n=1 Tax=Pseudothermotoga thermarum DSM 5069 TaxID=688269 RepID=F7YUR4_9THEM|nr:alpha-glucosidase AglA [Pseudothermotoga thermarum]AEH50250.1 glycoside hydrolase family 4 [Pseudothermotoga thermarum DSM 5069]